MEAGKGVPYQKLLYIMVLHSSGIDPLPFEEWSRRKQELQEMAFTQVCPGCWGFHRAKHRLHNPARVLATLD